MSGVDYLTFILGMTKALSWPISALIIFALTRKHILALLTNLKKLKHGDLEVNFQEELDEVKSQESATGADVSAIPSDPKILQLAEQFPKLAIIEAWQRIERLVTILSDVPNKLMPPPRWPSWAVENKLISTEQSYQYLQLKNLRNIAVHSHEHQLTSGDAYEYVELAQALQNHLEKKLLEKS